MSNINRRDFLKVLGWSGATVAVAGCGNTSVESGAETVMSYVQPEDFVVPGIGVYYASTCTQCEASCGVTGRVREGRILKLEGNPESAINQGRLCGLGQAAVQHHYNPDRLKEPMLRQGGSLQATTWDKAMALLAEKTGNLKGEQFALLSGGLSGHLKVLVQNYVDSLGSKNLYVYDALTPAVNRAVSQKLYGTATPRFHLDKAQVIVSFGADFLDTWVSPVHFASQYAQFRKAQQRMPSEKARGTLVQIEPRMTLTGANADRWIPIIPGTEGILALGLANALLKSGAAAKNLPAAVVSAVQAYDKARINKETGVSGEVFDKLVTLLSERSPSLVLSGPSAEGHAHGAQNAAAIMLLNVVLGNVGRTITAPAKLPFPQLAAAEGNSAALTAFNDGLAQGRFKTVFIYDANPVYTAPEFMKLRDNLQKAEFKVAFAHYLDETALEADLVLPLDSALEDWGTHIAAYQSGGIELTMQQPLMEKLYPNGTRSLGDVMLDLLKQRRADEYKGFADYYTYLKIALTRNKGAFSDAPADDEAFWNQALSHGVLRVKGQEQPISVNAAALDITQPAPTGDDQFPFHLVPAVRSGFRDGRHANLPWLQETPDSLTTLVWDSWVEIHPKTAERMGIKEGDILEIASKNGSIKTQAYLFPGVQPDTVAVPLGQGHEALGRYAKGVGVNPFKLLDPVFDQSTGELAMHATRVKVSKTGAHVKVVKEEGWSPLPINTQQGRKLVATIAADKANLSKEV
ncbi:MAG: molybdopterin-dependent oxidoreductase [Pseudomonadota bacterium]